MMADQAGTILLVEDDPNDQVLIRRAFTKAKLVNPVHLARDGDEAVAWLECCDEIPPALVLLDLKLPRRSGLEVLEWLRSRPGALGRTPIVVLTSSRENQDVKRAYELGANSYLVKPVEFDGLLEMIRTAGLYWTVMNQGPVRE